MKTPEPSFLLKRKDTKTSTAIIMQIRISKNEILRYYTRESISPKDWNDKTKRAYERKSFSEGVDINMRLEKFRYTFKSIFRKCIDKKIIPTKELIKKELDRKFFDFLNPGGDLIEYTNTMIEKMKQNKLMTNKGTPYTPGTIKTFGTALKHLKEFDKVWDRKVDFMNIDMDFYYSYIDYFLQNNISTNGVTLPIKRLKYILGQAEEEGIKVSPSYRNSRFVTPSQLVDKIYLSEEEILKIYNIDEYKPFGYKDNLRDRFIIACWTGMRFGDYSQVSRENLITEGKHTFLRYTQEKTGSTISVPLHWMVKRILFKHNYELPRVISNQKFNIMLKGLGEDAKINDEVMIIRTKGGKRSEEIFKKYDLITTHTARRSLATNLYKMDYSPRDIMAITGHKTTDQLMRYIRISGEDIARKIAADKRFNIQTA